jgi:hypothetical protein
VIVQHQCPDRFFTLAQRQRLDERVAAWRTARDTGRSLPAQDRAELQALIDAELEATARRTAALPHEPRRSTRAMRWCPNGLLTGVNTATPRCFVQEQREIMEPYHLLKPAGQRVEQRGQIAVGDDRLRNGRQGSVAVACGWCHFRRSVDLYSHA